MAESEEFFESNWCPVRYKGYVSPLGSRAAQIDKDGDWDVHLTWECWLCTQKPLVLVVGFLRWKYGKSDVSRRRWIIDILRVHQIDRALYCMGRRLNTTQYICLLRLWARRQPNGQTLSGLSYSRSLKMKHSRTSKAIKLLVPLIDWAHSWMGKNFHKICAIAHRIKVTGFNVHVKWKND